MKHSSDPGGPAQQGPAEGIDLPQPPERVDRACRWGSDALAEMLRRLEIPFVALNPGSSYRGLHDSLVNFNGNRAPAMLLCLHEEHAVAIAHGWAKVSGSPMAVALHANVGLMHGSMAIFNAWCDRVPMLILGATGPIDAALRRPWIDWLHTSRDQAALVRDFLKWDDQPMSIPAAAEALIRAERVARTVPRGPCYVNFDVALQERRLETEPDLPDPAAFAVPRPPLPAPQDVAAAIALLRGARHPVILAGRVSRRAEAWARRVALAEALGAQVLTDMKQAAAFPTDHPLHVGAPGHFLDAAGAAALARADAVLALDWVDVAGTMRQAGAGAPTVIASMDHQLHRGPGTEHQALPRAALHLATDPDAAVDAIADALSLGPGTLPEAGPVAPALPAADPAAPLDMAILAAALGEGLAGHRALLVRLPLGWVGQSWHFRHPLDYLGSDGGGGIGSGPGMLIGAALALSRTDPDRLAVAVLGDGDTMMSASAFWTAAHYRVPFVAVVANNRSFFNDEVHQERVARMRERPVANRWIGQRIGDPDIDIAAIARAQGLEGIGPVATAGDLARAVREAVGLARAGRAVVIDARVAPGYAPEMIAGLTRSD